MAVRGQGIDSSCGLTLAVFLAKELFLPSLAELAEPSGKRKPYTLGWQVVLEEILPWMGYCLTT